MRQRLIYATCCYKVKMDSKTNEYLKKTSTWKRILFMLFFAVIVGFVRMLLWMVVFFQVISTLFLGLPNPNARKFGKVLSVYLYQIIHG